MKVGQQFCNLALALLVNTNYRTLHFVPFEAYLTSRDYVPDVLKVVDSQMRQFSIHPPVRSQAGHQQ